MKDIILKIIELLKTLLGMVDDDGHVEAPKSSIPWFDHALTVEGMNEIKDGKVNPLVTEMFSYTSYKTKRNEPWCAAFICWCLGKTGFANPATAAAKGFSNYGVSSDYKRGAIIVMRHPSGQHHVTFFDSWIDEKNKLAKCYGGNQANSAKYSTYDFKSEKILGVRWPVVAKESTR
jgi:uncharacterized protein (TIGR02594 family)